MSTQKKSLVISLVFLIVLLGIFCAVKLLLPNIKSSNKDFSAELTSCDLNSNLITKKEEEIKSIIVNNKTGKYTIQLKKNEKGEPLYSLQECSSKEIESNLVEQSIVKNFIAELMAISPVKNVEKNSENLKKFGLDSEEASITLVFDEDNKQTLSIGNEAPLEIGYYLKDDTKLNDVYLITQSASEIFFFPIESFLVNAKKA